MVDMMYKLGSVHQMLFLGLQNLDTYFRYNHGSSGGISASLVATTLIYLVICAICVLWSKVAPIVLSVYDHECIGKLLEELGLQYSANTSLYIIPHLSARSVAAETSEEVNPLAAGRRDEVQDDPFGRAATQSHQDGTWGEWHFLGEHGDEANTERDMSVMDLTSDIGPNAEKTALQANLN